MPNPFALPEGMALFTFHGRVVRGKRLGSRLGFPTADMYASSTRAGIPPFPKESQRWKPICWVTRTATSTVWS